MKNTSEIISNLPVNYTQRDIITACNAEAQKEIDSLLSIALEFVDMESAKQSVKKSINREWVKWHNVQMSGKASPEAVEFFTQYTYMKNLVKEW